MTEINQKEYLKKYLSIGSEIGKKKKKKKKAKAIGDRIKIIDDDIDNIPQFNIPEEELFATNEEAPQIVAVIDDRPLSLRVDDPRKGNLWKPVGGDIVQNEAISGKTSSSTAKLLQNVSFNNMLKNKSNKEKLSQGSIKRSSSPGYHEEDYHLSGDCGTSTHTSPLRRSRRDSDSSPPRRSRKDSDSSPPRKSRTDIDLSSPHTSRKNIDLSPPRKTRKISDLSPPRKPKKDMDLSPSRKSRSDSSRKSRWGSETREDRREPSIKYSETSRTKQTVKLEKTLDGKTAGLQNAQDLAKETLQFREREESLFRSMPAEVSGINASTVQRDKQTGQIRDLEKEAENQRKKQEKEDENKAKYSRWGKGLKQVDDLQEKIAQDLHEMSKPLARYADDEDLERYLKEQEREGDPMLAYIRKKKKKQAVESGKPIKPQYEGEFMPNRFGIRPGYRWDGVDRSNGYEKKWFEIQNAKRAQQEEVYKWNTEDM